MKTFEFYGADDCYLERTSYQYGGGLALIVHSISQGLMAYLTVNIPDELLLERNWAFLDTNNNPYGPELVERLGLGEDMDMTVESGFCEYPLYSFDLTEVDKYITDGNAEWLRNRELEIAT